MAAGFALSKVQGEGGEIWIGKSTRAGSLASWIVVPGGAPNTWEFSARLDAIDEYWITQGPDVVRLPFGRQELRWQGALEIAGDRVHGTFVGPPEER